MARKTIEIILCDRCGIEIEKPYFAGEAGTFSLVFTSDFAVTGHKTCWKELCSNCHTHVRSLVRYEEQTAKTLANAARGSQ